jgi:hypothetical protein
MGVAEGLNSLGLIGDERKEAIGKAEQVIGGISAALPYVSAAKSFFDMMTGGGEKQVTLGEVYEYLKAHVEIIEKRLEELEISIKESGKAISDLNKSTELGKSMGVMRAGAINAKKYFDDRENHQNVIDFEKSHGDMENEMEYLLTADTGYSFDELYYKAWNRQRLKPWDCPKDIGLIWDYQCLLPALLEAITERLFVAQTASPDPNDFVEDYKEEIKKFADKLIFIHNKIRDDGVKEIPRPEIYDMWWYIEQTTFLNVIEKDREFWIHREKAFPKDREVQHSAHNQGLWALERPYGAVESYSGTSCVSVFNWDDIPGNDNVKLKEFLKEKFRAYWVETANIEKIENGKTIIVKVSTEKHFALLILNDKKTEIELILDNIRTHKFNVKMEPEFGKLKVYSCLVESYLPFENAPKSPLYLDDVKAWDEYNIKCNKWVETKFIPRHKIRSHKKKMEVYTAICLPKIWTIIQDLYRMIGELPPDRSSKKRPSYYLVPIRKVEEQ